jgi:hypothetical protein
MTQYARKVDRNHAEIRDAIRKAGYYVFDTHTQGCGFPDLLAVNKRGRVVLFEVKSPGEKLTTPEQIFRETYPGALFIVQTAEQAIDYLQLED